MICDGGLRRLYCSGILVVGGNDVKPGPGVDLGTIYILFINTKCKLTISTLSIKAVSNRKYLI